MRGCGVLQVNNAPCGTCGSNQTTATGMAEPTAAERPHAGRIEVYSCQVCGEVSTLAADTHVANKARRGASSCMAHLWQGRLQ
jgi:hypothetical protein